MNSINDENTVNYRYMALSSAEKWKGAPLIDLYPSQTQDVNADRGTDIKVETLSWTTRQKKICYPNKLNTLPCQPCTCKWIYSADSVSYS